MLKLKWIVAALLLFGSMAGFSQKVEDKDIPVKVKNKLIGNFPQCLDIPVSWEKTGILYKATFLAMEKTATVMIDTAGNLKSIERKWPEFYLPKEVKDALQKKYPEVKIVDIYQYTDEKERVTYKTTFTYQAQGTEMMNADGSFIKPKK